MPQAETPDGPSARTERDALAGNAPNGAHYRIEDRGTDPPVVWRTVPGRNPEPVYGPGFRCSGDECFRNVAHAISWAIADGKLADPGRGIPFAERTALRE